MAKWQEKLSVNETLMWAHYQNALDYQIRLGLRDKIPACIDFFEGRQWPSPTENTKNLPRPVVNIVKMVCRNKKGAILSTPVKISYKSFTPYADMERFNAFADTVFKEMEQSELDRRAIDDAVKKGSYFYHYYWDWEATNGSSIDTGALRCEIIDPLNIFFSNPSELDEQKQDWIIIAARKQISKIKALADKGKSLTTLVPDEDEVAYGNLEQDGGNMATLLTRYFKRDGEVWCERATKRCVINEPFKIIPDNDFSPLSDNGSDVLQPFFNNSAGEKIKSSLYPIVCGYYEKKEGSIYGIGEVEGLIPNQKAINFNIAMSLLNAQQCAWGKYIALPSALNGQKISNVPGQVLIDYSGTGEGIKRLEQDELSSVPMDLTVTLAELTRSTSGISDVMTGESYGSSLSGAAIAYLQAQAQLPIDDLRNGFWHVKRKQGRVVAQFLKNYYFKREFIKSVSDKNGKQSEVFEEFSSLPYQNASIDVTVEAIGGTKASIASDISLLDNCLKNGSISLETYIRAYPESAITNKEEILKQISLEKESELAKLRKELDEYKLKASASGKELI
ncbi:MAG: hypothetical protein IJ437_07175 [Clostridia bacterium]|nr:hypothetical protein [Clostridia bacterium]